jgi:tRNA nucleotidyltransferase/poly(A) polymerase
MVMGKKSKDIDITVSLPQGGIKLAEFLTKKAGSYRKDSNPVIYPTYGTAKFNFRGVTYEGIDISDIDIETVMTRKEQYKDNNRKPETDFGTIEQDVERRDLTINSLLYDISNNKILDLTGKGMDDIKNKVIRTPLDSNIIFKEDPLRMLRAIRFSVRYGWELSDDMVNSLTKNAYMLKTISMERINEEFTKIIVSSNPVDGIKYLMDTTLMKYIIPEYYDLVNMEQNNYHAWDAYNHSLEVLRNSPPKLEVRLASLLHDIGKIKTKTVGPDNKIHFYKHELESGKMSNDILMRLKYTTNIIKKVNTLVTQHMRTKSYGQNADTVSDKALRKLMHDMGDDLEDLLDVVHADNSSHGPSGWKHNLENQVDAIKNKLKQLGDIRSVKMPVDGDKIMLMLGLKRGPEVGKMIEKFREYFFTDPNGISKMTDVEIESILKDMYHELKTLGITK